MFKRSGKEEKVELISQREPWTTATKSRALTSQTRLGTFIHGFGAKTGVTRFPTICVWQTLLQEEVVGF